MQILTKQIKVIFASIVLVAASFNSSYADITDKLRSAIDNYKSNHILNAVYEIRVDGTTQIASAHGSFDLGEKILLDPKQKMPAASITKQMTAVSVLKLYEENKISLDAPISRYLDKHYRHWGSHLPEWADKVTIHQLLTHTHGLAEYIPVVSFDSEGSLDDAIAKIFSYAKEQGYTEEPKFRYNNTGYIILGAIIEKVSGMSLADYFNINLFEPADMNNTHLASFDEAMKFQKNEIGNYPKWYLGIISNGPVQFVQAPNDFLMIPYADGGVVSTTHDLNKWNENLYAGNIISPESVELMTTPHVKLNTKIHNYHADYGYGVFISQTSAGKVYFHGGRAVGIRSELAYIPKKKASIAILSNVYPHVPEGLEGEIDNTNPENQIDIFYFLKTIINTILGKKVEL
jgi:CubicO group peptidase (beta-lactamase class C family)